MNNVKIIVLIICQVITYFELISAQQDQREITFPLTIPIIEIYDLDSIYTRSMWLKMSIPPSQPYSLEEYVFTLILQIVVIGDVIWDEPFALVYELPGKEKEFIIVNEEKYNIVPERFNNFFIEIHSKKKGWVKFELALFDEVSGGVYVPINSYPLRRRDFLLE